MHYFPSERRAGRESKPFLVLNPKSNLDGSLEDSMAPEPLNNRICVACDSSQISRRVLVKSAPEVLVIQLNRVLPDGTKDSTVVDFPSVLSLPCRKHGQVQTVAYDLQSVICHQGDSSVRTSRMPIGTANGTYSMMKKSQPSHQIWSKVQSAPSKHTCMCLKSWAVSNQDSNLFSSSHARWSSRYSHS